MKLNNYILNKPDNYINRYYWIRFDFYFLHHVGGLETIFRPSFSEIKVCYYSLCEVKSAAQSQSRSDSMSQSSRSGFFSVPLRLCLAVAQHESSGKQKHYGCHSVSYSGNTVLQLKYNDSKRALASSRATRRHFGSISATVRVEMRSYLDLRLSFLKFSPAVTGGKSFCPISLGTA